MIAEVHAVGAVIHDHGAVGGSVVVEIQRSGVVIGDGCAAGRAVVPEMNLAIIIIGDRRRNVSGAAVRIEKHRPGVGIDDPAAFELGLVVEHHVVEACVVDRRIGRSAVLGEFDESDARSGNSVDGGLTRRGVVEHGAGKNTIIDRHRSSVGRIAESRNRAGLVGERRDAGGVGIDDIEGAFVVNGADDASGVGGGTQLQRPAIADRGAARIGVGADEDHAAAANGIEHLERTCAGAVADFAGKRQRRAVGIDRAAGRIDPESVVELQIAQPIGLKDAAVEDDVAGADRTVVGDLQRTGADRGVAGVGIGARQDQGAVAVLMHAHASEDFTDVVVDGDDLAGIRLVDDAAVRAGKTEIHVSAANCVGL